MNVDCFYCLRYLLMFIISLNMILGLTLLGASLWTFLHGARMGEVFADTEGLNYILYFLMVLGAVKFLIGFLGCCSVARKNSKWLAGFFFLMLTVFLGQVAAGVWLYIDEDKVTQSAKTSMYDFIQNDYGSANYTRKTMALDSLQEKFQCCGSNSPSDWSTSTWNENSTFTYTVPSSCCVTDITALCEAARHITGTVIPGSIYEEGCIHRMVAQVYNYGVEILGVVGGIILIELFVMTSTLILCRSKNVRYKL